MSLDFPSARSSSDIVGDSCSLAPALHSRLPNRMLPNVSGVAFNVETISSLTRGTAHWKCCVNACQPNKISVKLSVQLGCATFYWLVAALSFSHSRFDAHRQGCCMHESLVH